MSASSSKATGKGTGNGETPLQQALNCYYANRDTPVETSYPRANGPPTTRITLGWSIRRVARMYQIPFSKLRRAVARSGGGGGGGGAVLPANVAPKAPTHLQKLVATPEVRGGSSTVQALAALALQQDAELAVTRQQLLRALSAQTPSKWTRKVLSARRNVARRSLLDARHAWLYAGSGGLIGKQRKKTDPRGKTVKRGSDKDTAQINNSEVDREIEAELRMWEEEDLMILQEELMRMEKEEELQFKEIANTVQIDSSELDREIEAELMMWEEEDMMILQEELMRMEEEEELRSKAIANTVQINSREVDREIEDVLMMLNEEEDLNMAERLVMEEEHLKMLEEEHLKILEEEHLRMLEEEEDLDMLEEEDLNMVERLVMEEEHLKMLDGMRKY